MVGFFGWASAYPSLKLLWDGMRPRCRGNGWDFYSWSRVLSLHAGRAVKTYARLKCGPRRPRSSMRI